MWLLELEAGEEGGSESLSGVPRVTRYVSASGGCGSYRLPVITMRPSSPGGVPEQLGLTVTMTSLLASFTPEPHPPSPPPSQSASGLLY